MKIKVCSIRKIFVNILFITLLLINYIRYGLQISLPTEFLLLISLIISLLGDDEDIISLCFCCIPLYSSFEYIVCIFSCAIFLLIRHWKYIKFKYSIFIVLLLVTWELLHAFIGIFSIKRIIALAVPFFLLETLLSIKDIRFDYKKIVSKYSLFVIGTGLSLITKVVSVSGNNIEYVLMNMKRLGSFSDSVEIIGGAINPNSYGVMCVLGIILILQIYFYLEKSKTLVSYLLILLILGILTLSRTFIVCLIIGLALFFFDRKYATKKRLIYLLSMFVLLIVIFFVVSYFFPDTLVKIIKRWQVSDISNGRIEILVNSIKAIWSNPSIVFFGIGLQDYSKVVLNFVTVAPHDALHEIIMAWGMPGFFLFALYICTILFFSKKKNRNIGLVNYIPFIILIIKALLGHWITSGYSMLCIILVYISLITCFYEKNND